MSQVTFMSWPGIRCIGHTPSYSSTSRPPFRTITFAVKQQTAGNLLMNSLCRILLTQPWTPWRARPCRRDSRNCPHWSRTFLAASRNVLNDYSQHSVPLDTKFSLVARGYLAASCAMDNRLFRASGAPPQFWRLPAKQAAKRWDGTPKRVRSYRTASKKLQGAGKTAHDDA